MAWMRSGVRSPSAPPHFLDGPPGRVRTVRRTGAIALSLLCGCSALLGVDEVTTIAPDGDRPDAGSAPDGGGGCGADCIDARPVSDGDVVGDGGGADAIDEASDAGPDNGCPRGRGPSMVRVGALCIDSTEVTHAQYTQFLAAITGNDAGQPSYCADNTDFGSIVQPLDGTYPVTGVDWCDAVAFCTWANKRLCGAFGGGHVPNTPEGHQNAAVDQWFAACSAFGANIYPYGNVYDPLACNGPDRDGGIAPAGESPRCVADDAGIFDMSGNVNEWEDSCDAWDGGTDHCTWRSGSYKFPAPGSSQRCDNSAGALQRNQSFDDLGFRCCAP